MRTGNNITTAFFLPLFIVFALLSNFTHAQHTLTTKELLGQLNTITTAVPFLLIAPDSRAEIGRASCRERV